jgi:glycosyltransferase involved in cell wall biosynthesis
MKRVLFVALLIVNCLLFAFSGQIKDLYGHHDTPKSYLQKIPVNIVIPAYNEERRIGPTLEAYCDYFKDFNVRFIVVLNGVTDNTRAVVEHYQDISSKEIVIIESAKGKGNAVRQGFLSALETDCDIIGFVDADGSIAPDQYYKLLSELCSKSCDCDGVIASRYMKGSDIGVARPKIKEYGRRWFYNRPIKKKLGLDYHDYQCGAKLFKRRVIEEIAPSLTEAGWALDLDILYLCKQCNFHIHEIPIVWRDKEGSHLSIFASIKDLYNAVNRVKVKVI